MGKEARDSVKDERPFAGVHILAAALLCSAGATADELELARRLLERDPRVDAPREMESVAGAFNRHMDAAIDSLNDSAHEPFRVGRRARLAADLDRAGLVLVDRAAIASLIATVGELRAELARVDGEDLGAELLADEPCCLEAPRSQPNCPCAAEHGGNAVKLDMRPGGVTYDAIDDRGHIKPGIAKAIAELALPDLSAEETAAIVERINDTPNLHPTVND